jgi:hypothetical protein
MQSCQVANEPLHDIQIFDELLDHTRNSQNKMSDLYIQSVSLLIKEDKLTQYGIIGLIREKGTHC